MKSQNIKEIRKNDDSFRQHYIIQRQPWPSDPYNPLDPFGPFEPINPWKKRPIPERLNS